MCKLFIPDSATSSCNSSLISSLTPAIDDSYVSDSCTSYASHTSHLSAHTLGSTIAQFLHDYTTNSLTTALLKLHELENLIASSPSLTTHSGTKLPSSHLDHQTINSKSKCHIPNLVRIVSSQTRCALHSIRSVISLIESIKSENDNCPTIFSSDIDSDEVLQQLINSMHARINQSALCSQISSFPHNINDFTQWSNADIPAFSLHTSSHSSTHIDQAISEHTNLYSSLHDLILEHLIVLSERLEASEFTVELHIDIGHNIKLPIKAIYHILCTISELVGNAEKYGDNQYPISIDVSIINLSLIIEVKNYKKIQESKHSDKFDSIDDINSIKSIKRENHCDINDMSSGSGLLRLQHIAEELGGFVEQEIVSRVSFPIEN